MAHLEMYPLGLVASPNGIESRGKETSSPNRMGSFEEVAGFRFGDRRRQQRRRVVIGQTDTGEELRATTRRGEYLAEEDCSFACDGADGVARDGYRCVCRCPLRR